MKFRLVQTGRLEKTEVRGQKLKKINENGKISSY